jgi:large subunit ribosomal protein L22
MSGAIDLQSIAGAKAVHKYSRMSASKARVVLDLIRNEDLAQARVELQFCDRGAADVIGKVLESAVANATHNEHLDPEELYVAECWADEGPTLKRFRPRARGRASRIFKRTCHITVVVAQLDESELSMRQLKAEASGASATQNAGASRAARVAASRDDSDEIVDEASEEVVIEDVVEPEIKADVEADDITTVDEGNEDASLDAPIEEDSDTEDEEV